MNGQSVEELQRKAVRDFCTRPSNFPVGRPFNCCESVVLALRDVLKAESDVIPKIGTGLGAGVSLNGLLCGCVSSVVLAIGLKRGRTFPEESPKQVWDMVDRYVGEFRARFGHLDCRQLTGLDLKTEAGQKEYYSKVHDYSCVARIEFAIAKAAEMLET